MPKELTWDDADEIGILLSQKYPQVNPLEISYADLQGYITGLPEFHDDSNKSSRSRVENVKMAWHAEFLDRTQG